MANFRYSQLPAGVSLDATDLVALSQDMGTTPISRKLTLTQLAGFLASTASFTGAFLPLAGGTLTGPLGFANGANTATVTLDGSGNLSVEFPDNNRIVTINSGTASAGATGQFITGRLRYALPIEVRNSSVTVQSGASGVASALVRSSNASPMTLTVRENDGTPGADFQAGNCFSVMQEGAGQITLAPASANVILNKPAALNLKTREQYSVITATLYSISGAVQTWVVSGDLEPVA